MYTIRKFIKCISSKKTLSSIKINTPHIYYLINKDVKLYVKKPKYRIDISDTITKHKNGHAYNSDMYNSLIIHKGNYYMKIIDKGICIKNCYSNKTIIIINDRVISYQN